MTHQETLAGKILIDLRSGMSDSMLMEKHNLSHEELRNLYRDLFDDGTLLHPQIQGEPFGNESVAIHEYEPTQANFRKDLRRLPRHAVKYPTIIYERDRAEVHGRIHDISEYGVGMAGIEAKIDELSTFVILGDALGEVEPIEFRAKCRWIQADEFPANRRAGFEITEITEDDANELSKLTSSLL
jgi:hypothetical protein